MKLSDKVYNVLKWICLIGLPPLATFVITICEIWNLPYGPQIGATITAIGTLIGALIGISQHTINKEKKS